MSKKGVYGSLSEAFWSHLGDLPREEGKKSCQHTPRPMALPFRNDKLVYTSYEGASDYYALTWNRDAYACLPLFITFFCVYGLPQASPDCTHHQQSFVCIPIFAVLGFGCIPRSLALRMHISSTTFVQSLLCAFFGTFQDYWHHQYKSPPTTCLFSTLAERLYGIHCRKIHPVMPIAL